MNFSKLFAQRNKSPKEKRKQNFLNALKRLDFHNHNFKIITVAGTNGKSSVCNLIAKKLSTKFKVGSFVSPHVLSCYERIKINNQQITEIEFDNIFKQLEQKIRIDEFGFFEILTLVAVVFFQEKKIEYAVFECGIGAKWDCVNYLRHEYSILTSVSLDHEEILGETIQSIVDNKLHVANNSKLFFYLKNKDKRINYQINQYCLQIQVKTISINHTPDNFLLENLHIANVFLERVFGDQFRLKLNDYKCEYRFDEIEKNIFVDPAHNIGGFEAVFKMLNLTNRKWNVVVGLNKNKNIHSIINFLLKSDKQICFVSFDNEKSLKKYGDLKIIDIKDYFVQKQETDGMHTLFCGSFYFISTVVKWFKI